MLVTALIVTALLVPSGYFGYMYNTVDHENEYPELSLETVEDIKGKADSKEEFKMSTCCSEDRVCLKEVYPDADAKNKEVVIQEHTWDQWFYKEKVWFHKVENEWQVACMIKYGDSIEF